MDTLAINYLIDQAVNPHGGDPKIQGPALNGLLKNLAAEFSDDANSPGGAAIATLSAALDAQKQRLDTLVANAPQALDTLAEIGAQLAADEQGTAAILATQQQHAQQLTSVVHLAGDETVAGNKTFATSLNAETYKIKGLNLASYSTDQYLTPIVTLGAGAGQTNINGGHVLTITADYVNFLCPGTYKFVRLDNQGTIQADGEVHAARFVGDGSQLTNLPSQPAVTIEQTLGSNSATSVPSVAAVNAAVSLAIDNANAYKRIADAITASYARTYYTDAQSAVNGAGDGGTANIYSLAYGARAANDPTTTVPGLVFPAVSMITNLYGLALNTPDANTDVLTFKGSGKQVVNANNTTITTNPVVHQSGLGWTVTTAGSGPFDITLANLNIVITGIRTHAFYLTQPGSYRYSGNITLNMVPASSIQSYQRYGILNRQGTFYGKGTLIVHGNDPATLGQGLNSTYNEVFALSTNAVTTWEGNVEVYEDAYISQGNSSTLKLRNGILDARQRTAGAPLFHAAGTTTVVLENYALLCQPTEEAVRATTVILRGNTVVVGTINAATIIDERPVATSNAAPAPLPGAKIAEVIGASYPNGRYQDAEQNGTYLDATFVNGNYQYSYRRQYDANGAMQAYQWLRLLLA